MLERRNGRELGLITLFQIDVGGLSVQSVLEITPQQHPAEPEAWDFARLLVRGVMERLNEIDALLSELAEEWSLDRMAAVDRCILRLALYEMLYIPETPSRVVLNEAIELAKAYSTEESGRFVNGILAACARRCGLLESDAKESRP